MSDNPSPHGRPTKYKPEYCQKIIEHMKTGKSARSFAQSIDVCYETLREWTRVHPSFSDAYKRAMSECEVWWENAGHMALDVGNNNFNAAVWIFNMKGRFRWSDKHEVHHTEEKPVRAYDPSKMTKEEYREFYGKHIKKIDE